MSTRIAPSGPRRLRRPIAASAVMALALSAIGMLSIAGSSTAHANALAAAPAHFSVPAPRVPVLDPGTIHGGALGTDPAGRVTLSGIDPAATGALVRITAIGGDQDATVRTGTAPVLQVPAGTTVSTATLLPVAEGSAPLWADAPLEVRVEALAGFGGTAPVYDDQGLLVEPGSPGAVLALDTPVLVTDTAQGIGGYAAGPGEPAVAPISDIANGIFADRVAAGFVAVTVETGEPTMLDIDAQRFALPAGTTTFTTAAAPDERGLIDVSLDAGQGSVRVDLLGWVPASAHEHDTQLGAGGFALNDDRTTSTAYSAGTAGGALVLDSALEDASFALVLIDANPTGTELTAVSMRPEVTGRGDGIAVDPLHGAPPQLALAPIDAGSVPIASTRADVAGTVHHLGDVLDGSATSSSSAAVAITSHTPGELVDLDAHAFTELAGTVDTSAALSRVEISVNPVDGTVVPPEDFEQLGPGGLIGNAKIAVGNDGVTRWSLSVGVPVDGRYEFTATAFDRAGQAASANLPLDLRAVVSDAEPALNPDLLTLNTEDTAAATIRASATAGWVLDVATLPAGLDLDTVVFSGPTAELPEGLVGVVVGIERSGDRWFIHLKSGSLEDIVYDIDLEVDQSLDGDGVELVDSENPIELTVHDPATGETFGNDELSYEDNGPEPVLIEAEDGSTKIAVTKRIYAQVGNGTGTDEILVQQLDNEAQGAAARTETLNNPNSVFRAYVEVDLLMDVDYSARAKIGAKWAWKLWNSVIVEDLHFGATIDLRALGEVVSNGTERRTIVLADPLTDVKLGSFALGPVSVSNQVALNFPLKLDIRANAYITNVGFDRQFFVGARYVDGGWVQMSNNGTTGTQHSPVINQINGRTEARIEGDISLGAHVEARSLVHGAVVVQASVDALAHTHGQRVASPQGEGSTRYDASVRFYVTNQADISGQVEALFINKPAFSFDVVDTNIHLWGRSWVYHL